jgi:tellurite resistance protein TerC
MFSKLPYGLAIILSLSELKCLLPLDHIPSPVSLGIVGGVLVISVLLSIIFPEKEEEKEKLEE